MKKYFNIIVFFLLMASLSSQNNYYFSIGQTISKFKYTDSEGNTDDNIKMTDNFSYALGCKQKINNHLYIREEIGDKNLGANSSLYNQKIKWWLNYLDINLGLEYSFNEVEISGTDVKYSFYIGSSYYISRLIIAQQTIGINFNNLLKEKTIKNIDHGIIFNLGTNCSYKRNAVFFFELRYANGFNQLEKNSKSGQNQRLYNQAYSLNIGLVYITGNYGGKWKNK